MKTKGEITRIKILETTGRQKGSLYFHFSSKESIAREVLNEATSEFMDFLSRSFGGDNPGAALDQFFRNALDKHLATGFVGGCIFGNTALEMSDSDHEFAGMIDRVFDEWIARVASVVIDAQKKAGQIRTDLSAKAMAKHIIATIEGGIMMSRLKKDERPMRECLDTLRITLELRTESAAIH